MARTIFLVLSIAISCFAATFAAAHDGEQPNSPVLRVYANTHPPYNYLDEGGMPAGIGTGAVKAFLDKAGLPYEIHIVAWKRVMMQAEREENVLVYSLNRTPAREDKFHWILPLQTKYPAVFARTTLGPVPARADVANGSYRAVCNAGSSQCDFLVSWGIRPENLMKVPALPVIGQANLLLAGRADIMMADEDALAWYVTQGDFPADAVTVVGYADAPVTDYLAASKRMDANILAHLMEQAAKQEATRFSND